MIDKETAIALAEEAGFEMWVGDLHKLCNLAAAHAQKDADKTLITPGGGAPGDPCGILAAKDAEPCKHEPIHEEGFGASYTFCKHCNKEWTLEIEAEAHPAHDDTALLRQALEALDTIYASTHPYREDGSSTLSTESVELSNAAITALRERLGETG